MPRSSPTAPEVLVVGDDLTVNDRGLGAATRGADSSLSRSVGEALTKLGDRPFAVVLSALDEQDTLRLFREIAVRRPEVVRLALADARDNGVVEALTNGTLQDVVLPPWTETRVRAAVRRAIALAPTRRALLTDASSCPRTARRPPPSVPAWLIGADGGLKPAFELARTVAPSTATVLIRGETGTGKELFARLIHESSPRRGGPFVRLNCAAIADGVLESELFGHEPGAFTGATGRRAGRFELASGGTLFLDEIADISSKMQVRLLRVLQEREIERVGGSAPIPVDVRIVAATHQSLEALVERGEFREDLFYRLSVIPIDLPPLRERQRDIPVLVRAFVKRYAREGAAEVRFDAAAMDTLVRHPWPGNVRELENVVHRCVVLAQDGRVQVDQVMPYAPPISTTSSGAPARELARARQADRIEQALVEAAGNCSQAARLLGIPRTTFVSRAKRLGLI